MRTFVLTSVLVALATASLGCVQGEDDSAVVILFNTIPERGDNGSCSVPTEENGLYLSRGTIDANWTIGYQFFPLVKNYAVSTTSDVGTEKLAFVEGADIQLRLSGDPALESVDTRGLTAFSQRFSAFVSPDGGVSSMGFVIVPRELLRRIGEALPGGSIATIQATVQIFGLLGGGDFRTQEYVFWLDVCDGCGSADPGQWCGIPDQPAAL